ncbi:gp16 family protein [Thiomicrorhabdus cannonii]|uniref:gp16 family protein n=1 Tax=Thiomicrorhabdus cannonii TaxID=2748011 RepID=UPI0015C0321C|nr:regulatory protein GemA [Thiomicrorhabdus cannonii]
MSRQSELAQIHIAKKDLGMEDDAYRALLQAVAGVESSSDLDFHGRHAVIHRMKELGWKPKRRKVGPATRAKTRARPKAAMGDKIRALWLELHELGIVRDKSEAALMAYVKRMTGGKFEAPQFCDTPEAIMIIESLKKWKQRAQ